MNFLLLLLHILLVMFHLANSVIKVCNSTIDLIQGQEVKLINPPLSDKNDGIELSCWYTLRIPKTSSASIIFINVDRFSIGILEDELCEGGYLQVASTPTANFSYPFVFVDS